MSIAKLMHAAGGFRCEMLGQNLPLSLGLDGSAVLHPPASPCPPAGWYRRWTSCWSPRRS
ncbi:Uncharacterised protein [Serratia rubidaea]|uniref:Uncharacterized protein n=1 Tax=Serratia rubidaea TaxID=61652 RepID=A0A4U9HCQ0_SERRU|nr:Uncharacterised protein [Serratia rubidaea]